MALCHLLVCNLLLIFIYSISLVELHTAMWPKVKCTQMEPDTARCLCPFIPADIQTTNGRNAMCYCSKCCAMALSFTSKSGWVGRQMILEPLHINLMFWGFFLETVNTAKKQEE